MHVLVFSHHHNVKEIPKLVSSLALRSPSAKQSYATIVSSRILELFGSGAGAQLDNALIQYFNDFVCLGSLIFLRVSARRQLGKLDRIICCLFVLVYDVSTAYDVWTTIKN